MREQVRPPSELARERLGVGQRKGAASGVPNGRDQQARRQAAFLGEGKPWAVARRLGLLVEANFVTVMEGHAPAIDIVAAQSSAVGEFPEREGDAGRQAAGQAEQFSHAGLSPT